MKEVLLKLSSIDEVKKFNETVSKLDADVTLSSGRYCIDAKSIMGIFSLDLSKPVKLQIVAQDEQKVVEAVEEWRL